MKDLGQSNFDYDVEMDVLNICTPYDENFVDTVVDEIRATKAKLTIIYSTVAPFTTKKIRGRVRRAVVHSPVFGTSDRLYKGLRVFNRYIGGQNMADIKAAKDHIAFLGYKRRPIHYIPAVTTEINELITIAYTGVCMSMTDYVSKLLEVYKIPFPIFEKFNEAYNRGMRRIKLRRFNTPTFMQSGDLIDDNYIMSGTKIIKESLNDELIESVLRLKKGKRGE